MSHFCLFLRKSPKKPEKKSFSSRLGELLARVVDLDLFVDVFEDVPHLVLQAVQLSGFPLQPPLVLLVIFLQL